MRTHVHIRFYACLLVQICGNNPLHSLDTDLDGTGGILSHILIQTSLLTLLIPDYMETAAAADTQCSRNDEADSISLALTPKRFQLSHFCSRS